MFTADWKTNVAAGRDDTGPYFAGYDLPQRSGIQLRRLSLTEGSELSFRLAIEDRKQRDT